MALINCKLTGYEKSWPMGSTTGSSDGSTPANMRRGVKLVIRPRDTWIGDDGHTHSYRIAVAPNPILLGDDSTVPINKDLGHLMVGGSYGKPDWNFSATQGSISAQSLGSAYSSPFLDWACSQTADCTRSISPRLKNSEFNEYDSNGLQMINEYDTRGRMFGNRRYWAMGTWLTDDIVGQVSGTAPLYSNQGVNDSMFPDSTIDDDGSSYISNTGEVQDENFQSNLISTDINTGTYATAGQDGATSMILAANTKGVDTETSYGLEGNLIIIYVVLKDNIILLEDTTLNIDFQLRAKEIIT